MLSTAFATALDHLFDYGGRSDTSAVHTWAFGTCMCAVFAVCFFLVFLPGHAVLRRAHGDVVFAGHTHFLCDQIVNGVHMVSNQYGYIQDRETDTSNYNPEFVVVI